MIGDYDEFLGKVKVRLSELGFSLDENTDYMATFSNNTNWSVVFEVERYVRPAFDLSVSVGGLRFSVWILMRVFNVGSKPSLDAQLQFIIDKHEQIFIYPPPYAEEYNRLNDVES